MSIVLPYNDINFNMHSSKNKSFYVKLFPLFVCVYLLSGRVHPSTRLSPLSNHCHCVASLRHVAAPSPLPGPVQVFLSSSFCLPFVFFSSLFLGFLFSFSFFLSLQAFGPKCPDQYDLTNDLMLCCFI